MVCLGREKKFGSSGSLRTHAIQNGNGLVGLALVAPQAASVPVFCAIVTKAAATQNAMCSFAAMLFKGCWYEICAPTAQTLSCMACLKEKRAVVAGRMKRAGRSSGCPGASEHARAARTLQRAWSACWELGVRTHSMQRAWSACRLRMLPGVSPFPPTYLPTICTSALAPHLEDDDVALDFLRRLLEARAGHAFGRRRPPRNAR